MYYIYVPEDVHTTSRGKILVKPNHQNPDFQYKQTACIQDPVLLYYVNVFIIVNWSRVSFLTGSALGRL